MYMQALSSDFRDRIISSGTLPAHSPNLNPCDFFFWRCFEGKVYNSNPQMEEDSKENICKETANIPAEQLQRVKSKPLPLM
jgi:hypothetical protein